jgi:KipI family sensor histidine kinase inhibitor
VRNACDWLLARKDPAIASVRPALDSLVIESRGQIDLESIIDQLAQDAPAGSNIPRPEPLRVPICYDPEVAIDLPLISDTTGLSFDDITQLHCAPTYEVWMLGFMPGFPYMGKLPNPLIVPRKPTPSPRIPAGSVAVAEEFTGVYPFDSPGGWHVIGKTPWKVTDYNRTPPWLFSHGMQVRFYPITMDEFRRF